MPLFCQYYTSWFTDLWYVLLCTGQKNEFIHWWLEKVLQHIRQNCDKFNTLSPLQFREILVVVLLTHFMLYFSADLALPPLPTSPLLPILWKWLPPIPFALNSICRELRNWCRAYWSLKSKPFVSFRQEEEWRTHHRAEQQHLSSKPPGSLLCIVQKGSTFANCSIFRQNDGPMQPVRSF